MSSDKSDSIGLAGPLVFRGREVKVRQYELPAPTNALEPASYVMHADANRQLIRDTVRREAGDLPANYGWGHTGASGDSAHTGAGHRSSPAGSGEGEPEGGKELIKLHRMMRGRYLWAIGCAIILGGLGAAAGFKAGQKTFKSTGQIRVMPVVPKIMYSTDEKGTMPMFETYVEAQASLLRSQRVLDKAIDDAAWQSFGRGKTDQAVEKFAENLSVARTGDMIWISAVDVDANAARIAVKALIGAYQKLFDESEELNEEKRQEILRARQTTLTNELGGIRQRIMAIANEFGTEDLKPRYAFKLDEVNKLERAIGETKMALAAMTRQEAPAAGSNAELTVYEIAAQDQKMAKLVADRDASMRQAKLLKAQNLLENNPSVQEAKLLVMLAETEVQEYAQEYRKILASGRVDPANIQGKSEKALQEQVKIYDRLLSDAKAELVNLGQKDLQIAELKNGADAVRQRLEETRQRIEQLSVESTITGRISIISDGDRALGPHKDTRIQFAGAGGMGGVMLGLGSVLLVGFLDRRVRRPDEAGGEAGDVPLLGMLPKLSQTSDPEQAALASHCVHEIRTLLQIWGRTKRRQVLAVTSPISGAGKTSLTAALGVSFASARYRTLLVDCDFVGAGLSSRAESVAISEPVSDDVLAAQQPGILDALVNQSLEKCVRSTEVEGMFILPVGAATAQDIPRLAPEAFHRLVEAARRRFDVVLIDTGPIPGSLEASVVCGEADGVVLVVSRGERKQLIQRSVGHLLGIGARVAGVVFNRATGDDVLMYGSASVGSSRLRSDGAGAASREIRQSPHVTRFGPVARAVASYAPVGGSGTSSGRPQ
jgi:succinoglycan biosynthesis transport protein ExoP